MELSHDYFQENLALLKQLHPRAYQAVTDYTGEPLGEFCIAADGEPNLFVVAKSGEQIFFHDPVATDAELAGYYALMPEDATGVALFIGMGLGYTPRAMLKSHSRLRHLAIFEPEPGIFIRALQALDLASLLTDRRVSIAIGPDVDVPAVLVPMSRTLQLETLVILHHSPCFRFSPETYQKMHDNVYKLGNDYNISGNTTSTFGNKFIENRLKHLSAIHHQHLLEQLKGSFADVPAILVAAGPSLDKNIHLLRQAKGKALILAVDTALPALLAQGVTPDFTTCIDMDDITLEKIIDVAAEVADTSLVCASWVTSLVPKNFPARQVYWTFTAKKMERWLNTLLGGKVFTAGAGTVAQLNFISAIMLGCSPIIFVGQDLAFTDNAGHARHTSLTSNDYQESIFEKQEVLWVDGYGGGKVPTFRSYLGFKHHFEQSIAVNPDRRFINATEGGVRLEGAEELPLQEVLARYCRRPIDVMTVIREAEGQEQMTGRRRMIDEFSRMLKTIAGIEKDMSRLEDVTARLAKEIKGLQERGIECRRFNALAPAIQQQFKGMDTLNADLDKTRVWGLLEEITMEGLRQSERLNHEIKPLADQPERYLEYLDKAINRVRVINRFRRQVLGSFGQQLKRLHAHLQRENTLLQKLSKEKNGEKETVLELLRLYEASGDYTLMEKMLAEHCPDHNESAEISFLLGSIAAHRCQLDGMERHFTRTLTLDPSWSRRIDACREILARRYLDFAQHYQAIDQGVMLRMLFKAARYTMEPPILRQNLAAEAERILAKAEAAAKQGEKSDQSTAALAVWSQELTANGNLLAALNPEQAAKIYRYHGEALVDQEHFPEAREVFATALALSPQAPQLHLLSADAAFALDDYVAGITALDRAVALDRNYAAHWEGIGDTLMAASQPDDALAAYEKCFIALPERIDLLKKMGDCYLALDQPEAAREAYSQLAARLGSQ